MQNTKYIPIIVIILIILTSCGKNAADNNTQEVNETIYNEESEETVDSDVTANTELDDESTDDMEYDDNDLISDEENYSENTNSDVDYDSCFSGKVFKSILIDIPDDWAITYNTQQGSDGWHAIYESPNQEICLDIQCVLDESQTLYNMSLDNVRSNLDFSSTYQGVEVYKNPYEETDTVFGGRDCVMIKTYSQDLAYQTGLGYCQIFNFWLEDVGVTYTVQGTTSNEDYDFQPILESINFSNLSDI